MKYVSLVVFSLDNRHYALHLDAVERVLPSLEITPLPKAPEIVEGVINLKGKVLAVLDVRKRFRLPARDPGLQDHVIIARTSKRRVAIPVGAAGDVIHVPAEEIIEAKGVIPGLEYLEGIVQLADGLLLIHDLESFLSLDEERTLEEALKGEN